MPTERVRPDQRDPLVVFFEPDPRRQELLRAHLEPPAARDRGDGAPRRYRLRFASACDQAARIVTGDVSALALNLSLGRSACVDTIETVRPRRPDIAILCYLTGAPRADAMAAMIAGADHVVDCEDGQDLARALDLALDRRWLSMLIDRSAADIEDARDRLARLSGSTSVVLPGLRPPAAANAVLPFSEAVRRYLLACVKLFDGDPRGLADRLGVSYFALRRLLKRYSVPFPSRPQRGTRAPTHVNPIRKR